MASDDSEYLVKLSTPRRARSPMRYRAPVPSRRAATLRRRSATGDWEIKGLVLGSDEMREFTAAEEAEARQGVEGG
jgi:hypothetical protein